MTSEKLIIECGTHIGECCLCLRKRRKPADNLWEIDLDGMRFVLCSWCDVEEKRQWVGRVIPE